MKARFKLSAKFTLWLSLVFIGGIVISGFVLWQILQKGAQNEIRTQGVLVIEMMNAVRAYTSQHINPLLSDDLATQETFVSESVPAFSAREVFAQFGQTQDQGHFFQANFLYKEATLNPMNRQNQADAFERNLVIEMRREPERPEISGYRTRSNGTTFYIARPLVVSAESCLTCHGDPAAAPKSLITTYGAENGFGWQLNEIVAAQIVYVPAQEVFKAALQSFSFVMGVFVLIFTAVILLLNYLLKNDVLNPIGVMDTLAQKISLDEVTEADLTAEELSDLTIRPDELGQLAQVFQRMGREVYARTQTLKQQVQELRIEIDEMKRKEEVAAVVESDFFQDLQSKAAALRNQRRRRNQKPKSGPDDAADRGMGNE